MFRLAWAFRLIQLAEIPFEAIAGTPAGIMILRTQNSRIRTSAISLAEQFRQEGHLAGRQEAVLSNLQIRLSRYLWRTLSCAAFEGEMSKRPWALTVGVWSVRVLAWKEC